ncbi:MAG: hypothetical protein H7239_03715 [Flavobacterium sp.]|nr:hypothetical protein [Flavobacterium sp.]
MNYLKITKYIYLVIAIFLGAIAILTWNDGTDKPWLQAILALGAFITFLFRNNFDNKFKKYDNNNQPKP